LEAEFCHLKAAYGSSQALEAAIDCVDENKVDFNIAWKYRGATYSKLHEFFGALFTSFSGTPSVESDFYFFEDDQWRALGQPD
jgi:hypothetical protein